MLKWVLLLIGLCQWQLLLAQRQPAVAFDQYVAGGMVWGRASAPRLQVQAVGGIRWKNYFVGIGTGYDWYRVQSVPLFLDLKYFVKLGKGAFFVFGDGGFHFAKRAPSSLFWGVSQKPRADLYADAGIGYCIPLFSKEKQLFITVSNGYKQFEQRYVRDNFIGNLPSIYTERYRLSTIQLRLGIQF
jgi:hypothetical protein